MSNFLGKMFICALSLSSPEAFAGLPVFNSFPVTSNSMDDLPGKRFYMKVYEPETGKGKVPLQNNYKNMYYGKLKIGSDDQVFSATFDTGSSDIWVPGIKCRSIACVNKNRFDHLSSSSFVNSGNKVSVHYNLGEISGISGYDDITVGGIKVKSQGFIVANNISLHFNDAQDGAVLGLAYKAAADNHVTPWLDNAVQQGLIDKAVFSFYLSNTPGNDESIMIIGEPDPSYYQGPISWHYLTAFDEKYPKGYYYNISFDGISVGEKNIPLSCQKEQCKTIVDTGTSFILGPERDIKPILKSLDVKPDCSNIDQLPPLKVSIDSHIYEIPPHIYVFKIPNCFGIVQCQAGISVTDEELWNLGDSFIRAFYTIFDKTNERVGFAKLHDRLNASKTLKALY